MPFATRGGLRLYYELRGDPGAPPLLLIRGLARSGRFWLELLPELERDFRLVVVDNRGVGKSDTPLPPYTTQAMGADAVAVLDHAGLWRVHVFGISLGGMIAQRLAIGWPGRVDRLVLGATTAGGRLAVRIPFAAVATLLSCAPLSFEESMRRTAELVTTPAFVRQRPDVIERWCELARLEPAPRAGLVGQLLAGALHDASRELGRISAPTLVVTGDADRLIPPENSPRLASAIGGAELAVLPGAGHDFPAEQPQRTAEVLRRFLLTAGQRRAA